MRSSRSTISGSCSQAANLTFGRLPSKASLHRSALDTSNLPPADRGNHTRERGWRGVAHGLTEGEELIRHHAADHGLPASPGAVSQEPLRNQPVFSFATGLKFFPQNVSGAILFNWRNHAAHSTSKRRRTSRKIYGVTHGLKGAVCGRWPRLSIFPVGSGQPAFPSPRGGAFRLRFTIRSLHLGHGLRPFWEGKGRRRPRRAATFMPFAAPCRERSGWGAWRVSPWRSRRRSRSPLLDVGLRPSGHGDQVLYLFARRHVPRMTMEWSRGIMYFIREGLGEKWKPLALFSRQDVRLPASPAVQPAYPNRSFHVSRTAWLVYGSEGACRRQRPVRPASGGSGRSDRGGWNQADRHPWPPGWFRAWSCFTGEPRW